MAFCADTDVIGAEFYLMGFVDGEVLGDADSGHRLAGGARARPRASTPPTSSPRCTPSTPTTSGLGDLRRDGSYIERQLRRWHRQVHESSLTDLAIVDAVHERLVAQAAALPPSPTSGSRTATSAPATSPVGPDGRVRAIFDWELATLGDPLADLGWLIASWGRPADAVPPTIDGPSQVDGYPDGDAAGGPVRRALRPRRRRPRLLRGLRPLALRPASRRACTAATGAAWRRPRRTAGWPGWLPCSARPRLHWTLLAADDHHRTHPVATAPTAGRVCRGHSMGAVPAWVRRSMPAAPAPRRRVPTRGHRQERPRRGESGCCVGDHPALHPDRHHHGVAGPDAERLAVKFDIGAAVNRGPHLLGVERVLRALEADPRTMTGTTPFRLDAPGWFGGG